MNAAPNSEKSLSPTRRWALWIILLSLLGVVVGVLIWSWYRFRIWPEETRLVLQKKNLAVGYLENEIFDKSDLLLLELRTQFPREILPARNLLISRMLVLKSIGQNTDPEKHAAALQSAREALAALKQVEGETSTVNVLAGRLASYANNPPGQIEAYSKAVKLAPQSVVAWAELYEAARHIDNPVRKIQAREALKKAYALEPDNLVLLLDFLLQQAELNDPAIIDTLEHARQVVGPFAEAIRRRSPNSDILRYIEKALVALKPENETANWGEINRNVRLLSNVVRPETATQRDRARLQPYELEHIVLDFSEDFYKSAYLPVSKLPAAIPVSFVEDEAFTLGGNGPIRQAQFLDFDLDERLDILIVRDAAVEVHTRDESGAWKLLTAIDLPPGQRGAIAADLDRDLRSRKTEFVKSNESNNLQQMCVDADPDLCVYGDAGLFILRNHDDGKTNERTLELVPQSESFSKRKQIHAAVFVDLDQDGDLDLVASGKDGVSLWMNLDNSLEPEGFEDITARSNLPPKEFQPTTLIPIDWDRNIVMDVLLLGGESGTGGWLENLHHGRFRWQPFSEEFQALQQAESATWLDVDANASWDIVSSGETGIVTTTTVTPTSGVLRYRDTKPISPFRAQGLKTIDFDNDSVLDLLAWNEDGPACFRGLQDGRFEAINLFDEPQAKIGGCDVGDVDADGDLDLLIVHADGVALYRNEGGNNNHWIDISLTADHSVQFPEQRCNIQGIGSLLELKAGNRYQPRIVTGNITHFGLGPHLRPEVVRVIWTNGIPANIIEPAPKTLICEEQHLKGSCPYCYAWNGERFVFVTDLLWAAPIGLQFAEHVLAPSREWEYLRIDGDLLKPRDGEYHLQITEELWEAGYFDQVELIAVDHPVDLDVYTNEKVAPPELAQHRLRSVKERHLPIRARDRTGRDVLETIARRDEIYFKGYDHRIKQGLTEEHFLELDLGELENPRSLTLFLTGWMYPTDTSLNVGIGQNPEMSPPRPPRLLIPDAAGTWQEAIPSIGFPGGKTKTIAVDVPIALFTGKDFRLRIATSMEICWDEVFFTTEEPTARIEPQHLSLLSAELHSRGYSKRILHPHNGPDRYDYDVVSTEPHWPPMQGKFTRYGDVTELVEHADDCLVVLGSGDEMSLRFRAPPLPPSGWRRTFVLHNIGWDKDADPNTVHGETVEPLPFRSMKQYPYEPNQSAPDTSKYRDYLKKYQTRSQADRPFWMRVRAFGR